MNTYLESQILDALKPQLKDYAEAQKLLAKKFKEWDFVGWTVQDVLDYAGDGGWIIGRASAWELLHRMVEKHDADLGISWETIEAYLPDYAVKEDALEEGAWGVFTEFDETIAIGISEKEARRIYGFFDGAKLVKTNDIDQDHPEFETVEEKHEQATEG